MKQVDLHTHSSKSDGTYSPSQLVDYALEKGLAAIALTDHDTIDGLSEAMAHAQGTAIEVIPGIEFSTEYQGKDVHIVGLYIAYDDPVFALPLQEFVASRVNRNIKMCQKLAEAGIDISFEALQAENPGAVITRAHYGKFLLNHGYVKSTAEAFDRYLGDNTPYFVPREKVTPTQAIELILSAGGVPILAHPPLYHMSSERLDQLVSLLKDHGLMGIEALYATYHPSDERDMRKLAQKYDLVISGGSDFHGANKPGLDLGSGYGKLFIPEEVLTQIKEAKSRLT